MKVSYFHSHEQNKHACPTLRTNIRDCFSKWYIRNEIVFQILFFWKKGYENIKEYMNLKMIFFVEF